MYVFEKTNDPDIIKSVLAHESVYRHLHDDYAGPREEWEPPIHGLIHYFAVRDESGTLLGMFMANQHNAIAVEIHTAFLPEAWGKHVRAAASEFLEWIWANTGILRVIGKVVASNRASLRYAESLGFEVFGIDKRSKMVGGKLQDQIYFGISRP